MKIKTRQGLFYALTKFFLANAAASTQDFTMMMFWLCTIKRSGGTGMSYR